MTNIEGNILLWIQEHLRNDVLTPFFKLITRLANHGEIWILLCICLMLSCPIIKWKTNVFKNANMTKELDIENKRLLVATLHLKTGILASISLLLSFIVNNLILKNVIARVRPYEVIEGLSRLVPAPSDFS